MGGKVVIDKEAEPRFQFDQKVQNYLRRFDNPQANPEVQIFTNDSNDDDDKKPEERNYWCAVCKSKLTYMKHTGTIWKCDECQEVYDTKIQDRPISNNRGFRITPHYQILRYPTFDNEDPCVPFIKSINLNAQQDSDIEILRQSADGRTQHTRIRDNCTMEEAIRRTIDL